MSDSPLVGFATDLAATTKGHVTRLLAERDARIAALEARVQELEQRPVHKAAGVCVPGGTQEDADAMADMVIQTIKGAMSPLRERITALEARPRGLKYCGTWSTGATYGPGDTVSDKGSMWIAVEATNLRPGECRSWQLAVKSGRAVRRRMRQEATCHAPQTTRRRRMLVRLAVQYLSNAATGTAASIGWRCATPVPFQCGHWLICSNCCSRH